MDKFVKRRETRTSVLECSLVAQKQEHEKDKQWRRAKDIFNLQELNNIDNRHFWDEVIVKERHEESCKRLQILPHTLFIRGGDVTVGLQDYRFREIESRFRQTSGKMRKEAHGANIIALAIYFVRRMGLTSLCASVLMLSEPRPRRPGPRA